MAAGLRDLLALQGVVPVSAPSAAPPVSSAGFSLGKITGIWIDGAPVIIPPVKGDRPVSGSSGTNVGSILMAQHRKRLIREDDEILLMIMAAIEVLH